MATKPQDIIDLYNDLDSGMSTLRSHLREVADYMAPGKQNIYSDLVEGGKRMAKIYDGTPILALRTFASGLFGNLSPQASPWFSLTTRNKTAAENANVKFWLADTTERMRSAINASRAPLALQEIYFDEGWAGTGVLYVAEGKKYLLNCQTFSIANCCITTDAEDNVDGLYRRTKFSALQCIQMWGDAVSKEIKDAYEKGKRKETFEIIHAVFRRNDYDWRKLNNLNMPYASMYIEKKNANLLSEGGYQEFPYAVPRWDKSEGEATGRSCAMDALADTKMLNQMNYDNTRAFQKSIDPVILASKESALSSTNTRPGGVIYHKSGEVPTTLDSRGNFSLAFEVEERRERRIKEFFYNDLFQLLASDQTNGKTAYEISKRLEESISILGPALGRQQTELFDPFLTRVFWVLYRAGHLRPVPEELSNQGLAVDYVGRLALAMKSQETQATSQVLSFVSQMAQAKPEILDNFDVDEIAQGTAQRSGMPIKYLVSPDVRDKRRKAREQAQAEAIQAQQEAEMLKQVPNLSKSIEPNSPAEALMKAAGGGR
jgi:hypothetical protein